jgi:LPPG:FO 2-phospho-L-lactate transferase
MYAELGVPPSALAVAGHYRGLLTGFVLDYKDTGLEADIQKSGIKTLATNTFMKSQNDRRRLAEDVLNFIQILRSAA